MKYFLFQIALISFFFVNNFSRAQSSIDIVHLRDSTILKGTIIEQVPTRYIKIRTLMNKDVRIPENEIIRLSKEKVTADSSETLKLKKSGYWGSLVFGLAPHIGYIKRDLPPPDDKVKNKDQGFYFSWVNGLKVSRQMNIGLGIGYLKFSTSKFIPAFLSMQIRMERELTSSILLIDFGKTFGLNKTEENKFGNKTYPDGKNNGGLYFNPSLGLIGPVSTNTFIRVAAGILLITNDAVLYQEVHTLYQSTYQSFSVNEKAKFLTIQAGLAFN